MHGKQRERRRKQERASSGVEVNEALHGMKPAPGPRVRDARRPTDHRRPTRPTHLPRLASPPMLAPSSIFNATASPHLPAALLRGRVALAYRLGLHVMSASPPASGTRKPWSGDRDASFVQGRDSHYLSSTPSTQQHEYKGTLDSDVFVTLGLSVSHAVTDFTCL